MAKTGAARAPFPDGGDEWTGHLALTVRHLAGDLAERSRNHTHVRTLDRGGRGERAGVGLGLGDASALLHVGIQRKGDRRENAEPRKALRAGDDL